MWREALLLHHSRPHHLNFNLYIPFTLFASSLACQSFLHVAQICLNPTIQSFVSVTILCSRARLCHSALIYVNHNIYSNPWQCKAKRRRVLRFRPGQHKLKYRGYEVILLCSRTFKWQILKFHHSPYKLTQCLCCNTLN